MAVVPRLYDTLLEPLVRGFREAGVRLAAPQPGERVLDVGCGTGTHLALYAAAGCEVAGVDHNPDMVVRAAQRLPGADLHEADARDLPFADGAFDLAVAMHVLHEMDPAGRAAVVAEMARVAARVLVIDHHPTHDGTLRGRAVRGFTSAVERLAGGEHYRNYRQFLRTGAVGTVAAVAGLEVRAVTREGSGTVAVTILG